MFDLAIVLIILLLVVSIIDLKFKKVPSFFLTAIILFTLIVHFYNFEVGMISLTFGVFAFIYSWMLYELDFIGGVADVKFITIMGLMINTLQVFTILMILVVVFGFIYFSTLKFILKKEEGELIPFLPCLYAVYITLYLIGGIA